MNKLLTFGCSWTHGTYPEFFSWSREYALQHPEINVDDYSLNGTSLKWSVAQLQSVLPYTGNSKIVFQVTEPGRYTLADQNIDYNLLRAMPDYNLCRYTMAPHNHMLNLKTVCVSRPKAGYSAAKIVELHEALFTTYNIDSEELEWKMYIDYAVANADLVFFHKQSTQAKYLALGGDYLPCVEEHFGTILFNKWAYDGGHHLDVTGSQEVAKWITGNLDE
jgi:hypothetical protein